MIIEHSSTTFWKESGYQMGWQMFGDNGQSKSETKIYGKASQEA